jgi:hypothetical protein
MATRALSGALIVRNEVRTIDQRAEPRLEGVVERARLCFRDTISMVPVVNISSRGAMIESDIAPRLGETVTIEFDGCSRIRAFVRWSREGRVGLNFGGELVIG